MAVELNLPEIRRELMGKAKKARARGQSMAEFEEWVLENRPGAIEAIGEKAFEHLMILVWKGGWR